MAATRGWVRGVAKQLNKYFGRIALAVIAVLILCAILFYVFEHETNADIATLTSGFAWVTRTLLEGSSPYAIKTTAGAILNYVVLLAGVGLAATVTGYIASKLVEIVLRKGSGMASATVSNHIVICGWGPKGFEILKELHAEEVKDKRPVVILAKLEATPTKDEMVTFVRGVPSNSDDLKRAGIERADTAIILADTANNTATPDETDALTLLTALAVESVNPKVYTCVEVIRSENRQHFQRAKADEMVVSSELTGALLASSAVTHGLSRVITDLVTHPGGNEFYKIDSPPDLIGRSFRDAIGELKDRYDCVAIALAYGESGYLINPPAQEPVREGARFLVISKGHIADELSPSPAGS